MAGGGGTGVVKASGGDPLDVGVSGLGVGDTAGDVEGSALADPLADGSGSSAVRPAGLPHGLTTATPMNPMTRTTTSATMRRLRGPVAKGSSWKDIGSFIVAHTFASARAI